jgi:predicted ABC-type ATPase
MISRLTRVSRRVSLGGHDIPEATVRRRFGRSLQNFFSHYRLLADSWILFDNSGAAPTVIAFMEEGKQRIIKPETYDASIKRYEAP